MTRSLIPMLRLIRLTLHVLRGLWLVAWGFPRLSSAEKAHQVKAWAHDLFELVAIKVEVSGVAPMQGSVLLVANHISWLDIVLLLSASHCRFVAKSEISRWPVLGLLTRAAGTLFIARDSPRDALRVVHHMAEELKAGAVLAVFPEGTTSNGLQLLPFHANLFQAAVSAHVAVQPVALRFVDAATGAPSLAPCYIDDDSLLDSVWRTLSAPPLRAQLHFCQPQMAEGRDRRAWAADVRGGIQDALRQSS
jgi:1-acyl-sn-glycerol-3-phosphate acyltransferase